LIEYESYLVLLGFTCVSYFQLVVLVKKTSEKPAYGKSGGMNATRNIFLFRISAYKNIFWVV